MRVGFRKLASVLGAVAVTSLVSAPKAEALLLLSATTSTGTSICAADQNVACGFGTQITDVNAAPDQLALGSTTTPINVGGLLVLGSVATSTDGPPLNILSSSSLNITNPTAAPITATVAISDTSFVGPVNVAFASGSGTWQLGGGSTITMNWYNDPQNRQGAETPTDTPGTLIFTGTHVQSQPVDSFSFTSGPVQVFDPALFSMTLQFTFTLAPGGSLISRGMNEIKPVATPEPASLALLGLGFTAVGAAVRRRRRSA